VLFINQGYACFQVFAQRYIHDMIVPTLEFKFFPVQRKAVMASV